MEEVGAQVAAPVFIHQALSPMGRKRDFYYQTANLQQRVEWNPKLWEWDSTGFVAKPVDADILCLGNDKRVDITVKNSNKSPSRNKSVERSLQLNLGGGLSSMEEPSASRPSKRVRSGSPGGGNRPMCQVDNCKEDLSKAKDYHRRHKVCELHSKASKALVCKQMQRFCQQCSRFHPLSEFDEGKRSCRRRLAGHNRRRRKTQAEDVTSQGLVAGNQDYTSNGNMDLVALLTALASAQGKNEPKSMRSLSMLDKDQLAQILNKINSLPLPMDLDSKLNNIGSLTRKNPEHHVANHQNEMNDTSPSTLDLLAVLSTTLAASSPEALPILSQQREKNSDTERTKLISSDLDGPAHLEKKSLNFPSVGGERSSSSNQSPSQDSDGRIQDTRSSLSLQLFTLSPENESRPTHASSRKCFSSDSSNPIEDRSASSSPVVQELFPMQNSPEIAVSKKTPSPKKGNTYVEVARKGCLPLELFSWSNRGAENATFRSFLSQSGYTSSGSDNSPSSLYSDTQDHTGRILFKLFDKDPSHLPGTLRTQIYNWLSSSPSEMESYIRPGCVILSVYVSMTAAAWNQLEANLVQRISCLVRDFHSDFWRNASFLVSTGKRLASYKHGKICLTKSWRTCSSPELISVSPLAVVAGQKTTLRVKGRNLINNGIKIRCAYMGRYTTMEFTGSTCRATVFDELNLNDFQIQSTDPGILGRCFIEVENGFRGNGFPLIIADATICKEMKHLENEFQPESKLCDDITEEYAHKSGHPKSKEEALRFLNELGWLFQGKKTSHPLDESSYSLSRFRFLLVFSVERDCSALVKTLLDMMVERNLDVDGLSRKSLETLAESQLLNRAVKRGCTKMVEMLIHYSITAPPDTSKMYIFPPNLVGTGGLTPLHLAASTSGSDNVIDLLTNDPQEIGLSCWDSLLDASGHSPHSYAAMRNNHAYNILVARKLADKINSQVSLTITNDQSGMSRLSFELKRSCTKCATVALRYQKRVSGSHGLFPTPIIHSMLAIATVCVCVCLFMHAFPNVRQGSHFSWKGLDYGTV